MQGYTKIGLLGIMAAMLVLSAGIVFAPANQPPVACFTVNPTSGIITLTNFSVDASCSTDDTTPTADLQVRWDWTNDGVWDTPWNTTKTASNIYNVSGNITIKLIVKDKNRATNTTTQKIIVYPWPCFEVVPTEGNTSTLFKVNATCSKGTSLNYKWDWENDGIFDTPFLATPYANHTYTATGTYTIYLVVIDPDGGNSGTNRNVQVT